jgi:hypothetical protein
MKLTPEQQISLSASLVMLHCQYGVTCMAVLCSCGEVLKCKDGRGETGISTSLCPACKEKTLAEIRRLAEGRTA